MKKSLLIAALALTAFATQASILYNHNTETFTAGNIAGQNDWVAHNGAGSVPVQVATDGAVTLVQGAGSREDVNIAVTPITAGKTYFFGFDVVVTGGSTNAYFAHFKDAGTGTDFTVRTFITSFGGSDFTFGLSAAGSAPDVTWAQGLTFGDTYRVVGSYDADTRENRLWVNPTNISSTSISFVDPTANPVAAFALRQTTGNSTQVISNLIVSDDFTSAAIPEPSMVALLLVGFGIVFRFIRRK
jgi:hypothetical protein